jgi:hypothetical protein
LFLALFRIPAVIAAAALFAVSGPARATPCRLYLAQQYDWGANRGFYLDFENDASTGPCKLVNLQLILGVANGTNWRFIFHKPTWQLNHDYTAKAVITPTGSELWLDGAKVGQNSGGIARADGSLSADYQPDWAAGPAEYWVIQSDMTATSSAGGLADLSFVEESSRPVPLMLFAPYVPKYAPWNPAANETQTFTATFRIIPLQDPSVFSPYVDRYGQSIQATWPGKIASDADLLAAMSDETARNAAWGIPSGFDAYGGSTTSGWREAATGYFNVVKRNGFWWLISPDGNPCFYRGICTAPSLSWEMTPVSDRQSIFAELPSTAAPYSSCWGADVWGEGQGTSYVAFHTANMIRKYGAGWQNSATQSTKTRARIWGFAGLGKWSDETPQLADTPVLNRNGIPNLVRHPDIFDTSVQATFRSVLSAQVTPRRFSPLVVGWTVGSEIDEIVTTDETASMLNLGSSVPAKRALVDYALSTIYAGSVAAMASSWKVTAASAQDLYAAKPTPPAGDVEALRRYFATEYYGFIYRTIKSLDPNHLYFGNYIVPGWWQNEEDWRLIAANCDVIGYDRYAPLFADATMARLIRDTNKPVFAGEFSFPPFYSGLRAFGRYEAVSTADDADAGAAYAHWMRDATANPFCIGGNWFEYRDQAITGRGPGRGTALVYGEHYAFGLVDMNDRPKWDLVSAVRAANLGATASRLAANDAFQPLALSARAMRIAGGFSVGTAADIADLDTVATGSSANRIDLADALALAVRGL